MGGFLLFSDLGDGQKCRACLAQLVEAEAHREWCHVPVPGAQLVEARARCEWCQCLCIRKASVEVFERFACARKNAHVKLDNELILKGWLEGPLRPLRAF